MKRNIFFLLTLALPLSLPAQHTLESRLNTFRAGDEIIKQQVEYKNPGRSGENVLWDFGQLNSINDEYTLTYSAPALIADSMYILGLDTILSRELTEGSLMIGTEHNTMYYYYQTDNRLWVFGHENPLTLLRYFQPLIAGIYPMHYKDSCRYDYQSEGLYSSSVNFSTHGEAQLQADAYGMMILPSGDTLRNVLRTHTVQTICQVFHTGDTIPVQHRSSIATCKWYSKGYRYPIFETIQTTIPTDSVETVHFETAFFFPPQDHYYLEEDEENLAIVENENNGGNGGEVDPWEGLTYNFYPNPVVTNLEIEIYMPRAGQVRMQLMNRMGLMVWTEDFGTWPEGIHTASVYAGAFPVGEYVLNMWFDDYLIGEKIIKR